MAISVVFALLSRYLQAFSIAFCVPLFIALYDHIQHRHPYDSKSILGFFLSFVVTIALGALLRFLQRQFPSKGSYVLLRKEAILSAALIWLITPLLGSLPYLFSGALTHFSDALFESTSGFTTTGASILTPKLFAGAEEVPYLRNSGSDLASLSYFGNIQPAFYQNNWHFGLSALPRALLFWRSFSQWLGGMGIIVLFVAMAPSGGGSRFLFQSEVTGPTKDAITPRAKESASLLWKIYIFLTVAEIGLLSITHPKLSLFDSLVISFSTISTGGFTIWPESIAHYQSAPMEWIILLFMVLGGLNFALYPLIYQRRWRLVYLDRELALYLGSLIFGSALICHFLGNQIQLLDGSWSSISFFEKLRISLFHYVSAQTSTGFATSNFDIWHPVSQVLLLLAMYLGGMSGSTAGGMKIMRHYILLRFSLYKLRRLLSPHSLSRFSLEGQKISEEIVGFVFVFFFLNLFFSALSTLIFLFSGVDQESALALSACFINNVGFSFRLAGPMHSFAFLSSFGKLWSCFIMILGRLEFFTLLLLFLPGFFTRND